MDHPLFGPLYFNPEEACWEGYHPSRRLAVFGLRTGQAEEASNRGKIEKAFEQANALWEQARGHAAPRPPVSDDDDEDEFAEFEATPLEEAYHKRQEAKQTLDEDRKRRRQFPFQVASDTYPAPPTPQQEAAFRHLMENDTAIADQVMRALQDSHTNYLGFKAKKVALEAITGQANLDHVQIMREHHDGVSYLVFNVDCDWEIEHGMAVVYHPEKGAEWTTADGLYDLLESDAPVEPETPPAPNEELVNAVLAGDVDKARELIAQGQDINDLGPQAEPPLNMAVMSGDLALVKRLLAVGADPLLVDWEGRTALQRARQIERTFRPKSRMVGCAILIAKFVNRKKFVKMEKQTQEMVRLLEEATAKRGRA